MICMCALLNRIVRWLMLLLSMATVYCAPGSARRLAAVTAQVSHGGPRTCAGRRGCHHRSGALLCSARCWRRRSSRIAGSCAVRFITNGGGVRVAKLLGCLSSVYPALRRFMLLRDHFLWSPTGLTDSCQWNKRTDRRSNNIHDCWSRSACWHYF